MQSMIILAATLCLAQASYYHGLPAPVQDTAEVAHAKAAHFAAHAQAASSAHGAWAPASSAYSGAYGGAYGAGGHYGAPAAGLLKYGPAPLAHDGRVIDTPEVAHLKAAHIAAHATAHANAAHGAALAPLAYAHGPALSHGGLAAGYGGGYGGGYGAGYGKWNGPIAHIQLTHDGQYVVDTPEVQHARASHLAQYSAAAHAAAAAPEEPWGHSGHSGHGW